MNSPPQRESDIPLPVALVLLAVIPLGLFYFESPRLFHFWQSKLESYFAAHFHFAMGVLGSLMFNVLGAGSLFLMYFGSNQQGRRLAVLARNRSSTVEGGFELSWQAWVIISIAALGSYFVFRWINEPNTHELNPLPLSQEFQAELIHAIQLSYVMNVALLGFLITRMMRSGRLLSLLPRSLPKFPAIKNTIVLGSTGDEDPKSRPSWIWLGSRALTGNLFITGSIGMGKTQGTILTFLKQILSNFSPMPSILAIDPKGTFIPEALKMIKELGLEKHILHLKLGGNVTFNPIYSPKALKNAEFLNITQMIRAAALNFTGGGSDSPFWELSAFNLMKNSLALCAAKNADTVYTLNDLYSEMIRAAGDAISVSDELLLLSQDQKFDAEEQFNIRCAGQYFKEFDQMETKLRTGILATATAFLNQFQEYQASQIFCPSKENTTLKSMDEVVDQGKILLFDIASPALARSMGTFIKLHYEQSVLNRLTSAKRGKKIPAVLIADEYQDVVSTGGGLTIGDDRFCAKSREANAIAIFATQSLTSIKNSIGKEDSAKELIQNFRTMIAGHSTDLTTIHHFQELMGQEDRTRMSRSISENAQSPSRNLILGGFDAKDANISESISTSQQKEYSVTGKEFATLSSFECFARVYDGNQTSFTKLYLKPYFLGKKNTLHPRILKLLKMAACLVLAWIPIRPVSVYAFPNVCTVLKTSEALSCLDFKVGACMCGFPPRPCAQFTYFVPETFVEVFPDAKSSYFGDLPGAAAQLESMGSGPHYGAEADNDTHSFQAHALTVPLNMIPFETLPCGASQIERTCFNAMSEHLGDRWKDGAGDSWQPKFLAWGLSPKACLLRGAAASITGELMASIPMPATPACSVPLGFIPKYPPSEHEACTGWGAFYPRSGVYNGVSQTAGALMIAARMKSLGSELFHSVPSTIQEKWQMITPEASSCFKEGQNVAALETFLNAREEKRLVTHQMSGFLFSVWNQVSCCRDLAEIPTAYAAIAAFDLVCQGVGSL